MAAPCQPLAALVAVMALQQEGLAETGTVNVRQLHHLLAQPHTPVQLSQLLIKQLAQPVHPFVHHLVAWVVVTTEQVQEPPGTWQV